ncbi:MULTISPECIES: hypothetical protein [unclassified Shinella]|uniref:hypothetical protein n=1 Tax=unclassified Shinella TaxID=2643062 RepID=UPI00225C7DB3|nr:conserved hypothetical protein [Rhizobiaceae bacterium]CAK7259095.1 Tail fiber domain-containing protein [Shinella sp. WSC3-e]
MGGGGKGGGGEAKKAREDEQKRQEEIRKGTARINEIFGGRSYGTGALSSDMAFDPNGTYFLADGTKWKPQAVTEDTYELGKLKDLVPGRDAPLIDDKRSSLFTPNADRYEKGKLIPGQKKTAEEQYAEMVASGKLFSGTKKKGGFTDDYFKGIRQKYIDYANPQLEDQYGDAQKELTFALARGGLLDSSVRGEKAGELQQLYDLNKQQVADQALAYEGEARNAVEDARSNLIATLNATGDAQGAANSAIARASALSKPAAYSPLAQLFTDFTAGLGTQAALERANYYGGGEKPRYTTGLFTPKNSTVVK